MLERLRGRALAALLGAACLCGGGAARGQGSPAAGVQELPPRLEALEAQRLLDREYRACVAKKDDPGALHALVKTAQLPMLVPPPFEEVGDDLAARLLARARDIRLRIEEVHSKSVEAEAGAPAKAPEGLLEALDAKIRTEYQGDDLGKIMDKVIEATGSLDTGGFTCEYNWGRRLRALLPHFPCVPSRLRSSERSQLKEEWKAASMPARRDFLKVAVLEARAFGRAVSFLDTGEKPSLSSGQKDATLVAAALLQLVPEDYAGKWVLIEGTWAKPAEKPLPHPFLFKGLLPIEELDRRLLLAWYYRESDQDALQDAGRLGIAGHLSSWPRSYPARAFEKKIEKLSPGDEVEVLGRVLPHPGGAPSHVLEVWKVERAK